MSSPVLILVRLCIARAEQFCWQPLWRSQTEASPPSAGMQISQISLVEMLLQSRHVRKIKFGKEGPVLESSPPTDQASHPSTQAGPQGSLRHGRGGAIRKRRIRSGRSVRRKLICARRKLICARLNSFIAVLHFVARPSSSPI